MGMQLKMVQRQITDPKERIENALAALRCVVVAAAKKKGDGDKLDLDSRVADALEALIRDEIEGTVGAGVLTAKQADELSHNIGGGM